MNNEGDEVSLVSMTEDEDEELQELAPTVSSRTQLQGPSSPLVSIHAARHQEQLSESSKVFVLSTATASPRGSDAGASKAPTSIVRQDDHHHNDMDDQRPPPLIPISNVAPRKSEATDGDVTYYSPTSTLVASPSDVAVVVGTASLIRRRSSSPPPQQHTAPADTMWSPPHPSRPPHQSDDEDDDAPNQLQKAPALPVVVPPPSMSMLIGAGYCRERSPLVTSPRGRYDRVTSTPPNALDFQSDAGSYSPREGNVSPDQHHNVPPTRFIRGREDATTPMSSVSDQTSMRLTRHQSGTTRHHRHLNPIGGTDSCGPNEGMNQPNASMAITSSDSHRSRRARQLDPNNEDDMDEHIQQLFTAHEPGAERFETDRELISAVERKVSDTVAKLDAGEDYEQTPLTEAIIRRHLEKQRRIEAELALQQQQYQLHAGHHLGSSQQILLTSEQRNLLAIAGYMDDFLPHLHNVGPKSWYPMGELRFEASDDEDNEQCERCGRSGSGDCEEEEDTFERPASTNAPGGIKPYRPPTAQPPHSCSVAIAAVGPNKCTESPEGGGQLPHSISHLHAACKAMLWKGYRAGKPFIRCSIFIPLALSIIVAAIFRYAGGPVCGGSCSCTVKQHVLYVFTYGLAVRVLPTAILFTYFLHIVVFAHHKVLLEQGEGVAAGSSAAGARVMMSLTSRRNSRRGSAAKSAGPPKPGATTSGVASKSSPQPPEDDKTLRQDAMEALRSPTSHQHTRRQDAAPGVVTSDENCAVPWDVPSLKFCAQQTTFRACALFMTVLMSLTQFASAVGFPGLTIVPVEAAALFLPTVSFCFILRVPKAVWPMIALEAFPFVAYFAEPSLGMPQRVFQLLWPFLVVVAERLFFYAFAAVSPPSLPIGARVAATTILAFTSHILILMNSVFVPREVGPLIGVGMQVLLYELLLGTLVLDRIFMVCKAQWQFRVRGEKPQMPQLAASDLRCIGTQTRWCSLVMAMFAMIPLGIWKVWPRAVKGGLSCSTGSVGDGEFHPESLGVVVGCFFIAAAITGMIRRCNNCLRAPLMVRGVGFPITIGLYLFSTATLGLAAGAY